MSTRRTSARLAPTLAVVVASVVACAGNGPAPSASSSESPSAIATASSPVPTPSFTGAGARFCAALYATNEAGKALAVAKADVDTRAMVDAAQQYVSEFQQMLAALPADAPERLKALLVRTFEQVQGQATAAPGATPDPSASVLGAQLDEHLNAYATKECGPPRRKK